jgi:diguanylate cyclase (GGDEF)-like protein
MLLSDNGVLGCFLRASHISRPPELIAAHYYRAGNAMRILIAEDDPVARCRLEDCLHEWGYEVITVSDGAQANRVLQAPHTPQLALLDWMMPGLDGRQVCRAVRDHPSDQYIYIILVTSKSRSDEIAAGFEAGVDDYLPKPFELFELRARLLAGQRIIKLQDDLIAAREAMRHQATHDALTGVWNRHAILETLERELERGRREGRPVSVIMADLDHFKHINDTLGHQAGDAVLQEAIRRVAGAMRTYDAIGRYGGEEFVIVLPGLTESAAVHFAERLRERVAAEPIVYADAMIHVTMSLGVVHDGPAMSSAAEMLLAADKALYQAKDSGRNRVAIYSPGMTAQEVQTPHHVEGRSRSAAQ